MRERVKSLIDRRTSSPLEYNQPAFIWNPLWFLRKEKKIFKVVSLVRSSQISHPSMQDFSAVSLPPASPISFPAQERRGGGGSKLTFGASGEQLSNKVSLSNLGSIHVLPPLPLLSGGRRSGLWITVVPSLPSSTTVRLPTEGERGAMSTSEAISHLICH